MNWNQLFEGFKQKRVLVIGDVMIDAYLKGKVSRISPEAPVPIVNLESREDRLGGAANVAMNVKALGANAILCSVIGRDSGAERFMSLMQEEGLLTTGMVQHENRKTAVKTRVLANNQQVVRVDDEEVKDLSSEQESELIRVVKSLIDSGVDAIIFEDYNKGTLTEKVIHEITELANAAGIPSAVDPKFANFLAYKNVTLFKPNLKELQEGLGRPIHFATDRQAFEQAVLDMESRLNNKISFVTLSEHGVFIKDSEEAHYISAHIRSIADVSGAGDTVIAVASLALASGSSVGQIAALANLAGGLVCEYRGVVPVNREKLLAEAIKTLA